MKVAMNIVRWVDVKRSAIRRLAKADKEGLCVACLQPLDGVVKRGCHERCYQATLRAIREGKFTMEDRITEGKIREANQGRRPSNPVTLEAEGLA